MKYAGVVAGLLKLKHPFREQNLGHRFGKIGEGVVKYLTVINASVDTDLLEESLTRP